MFKNFSFKLKTASACCIILLCALPVFSQTAQTEFYQHKFIKVSDDIYVAVRPEPFRIPFEGNVTFIINDKYVVVVDASGTPKGADDVIEEIKKHTSKPVRFLINTHWHGDHTFGNQEFVKNYPGVTIISTKFTREMFSSDMIRYPFEYSDSSKITRRIELIDSLMKSAEDEKFPGYKEVVDNYNKYITHDIFVRRDLYKNLVLTPPDITFNDSLTLHCGNRDIQILYLGEGDTKGDAWIYLPDDKVLITGDPVANPVPFGLTSTPIEMLSEIKKAAQLDFNVMIPGHGDVQYDKNYINLVISAFESVYSQVKDGIDKKMTLEEISKYVDTNEFKDKFNADDGLMLYYFNGFFRDPAIEQFFTELTNPQK